MNVQCSIFPLSLMPLLLLLSLLSPHTLSLELQVPAYQQKLQIWSQTMNEAQTPKDVDDTTQANDLRQILDLTSPEVRDALVDLASLPSSKEYDVSDLGGAADAMAQGENVTVSWLCLNHTVAIAFGIEARQLWALQMLDATGKPPPGILDGNLNWPGKYNQCLKVRYNTSFISLPQFSGRYCSAFSQRPPSPNQMGIGQTIVDMGVCVPDSCSSLDLTLILQYVAARLNKTSVLNPVVNCVPEHRPIEAKTIVAIVVCGLLLCLMVVGTLVDIAYVQWPNWKWNWKWSDPPQLVVSDNNDADIMTDGQPSSVSNSEYQPLLSNRFKKTTPAERAAEFGVVRRILLAFSVYTNGSKLLSTHQSPGSLTCLHGLRFFSMSWVVLGHSWGTPASVGMNLVPYLTLLTTHWTYQGITNAFVSVDSFFVLSGLLVAYLTLKELKRKNGRLNWFLFYFHRFWRLTPTMMLCMMVAVCLAPYMGSGPFWTAKFVDEDFCAKNWWTNLLYINNLVKLDESCFGISWYLANDMQFYVLSPLLIVPLYFFPVVGYGVCGVFLLATSITPGVITQLYHLPPGILQPVENENATTFQQDYMKYYYFKPYNRMGAYVVGMLAGYFLYRTDCKLRIPKVLNLALWAVAIASGLAVVYGLSETSNGHPVTLPVSAFYNAVHRQVWAACLCWVIIACVTGNGGFVNTLLSWPALIPLSRLTYCTYLLHITVLELYVYNLQYTFYLDDVNLAALFIAILVVSLMVAFVASLAFEAPMLGLEKVLLHRSPPHTAKNH